MDDYDNKHYIVAVNADDSYPITNSSHSEDNVVLPEVTTGHLAKATVTDGQITIVT